MAAFAHRLWSLNSLDFIFSDPNFETTALLVTDKVLGNCVLEVYVQTLKSYKTDTLAVNF